MKLQTTIITMATGLVASSALAGGPPKVTPELLAKGKASFTTNCLPCHGEKGDGNGPAGAALNPKPRNFATDAFKKGEKVEEIFKTLGDGIQGTAMVAFLHLPEEDRWALANYVLELKKAGKPAAKDKGKAPAK